ncbi:MAG: hypothetical protein M3Q23_13475 [Actinomycetota bacterium]|nr:hypothetical protein [Actinomycetota bacterium]
MTAKGAARLAWSSWAAGLAFAGFDVFVLVQDRPVGGLLATLGLFLVLASVGAVVASRRPRNPIGWLFLGSGLVAIVEATANALALHGLEFHRGSVPGAVWWAWLENWLWLVPIGMLLTFLPLLFPDGRLPSPRWRPFAWATGCFLALTMAVYMILPGRYEDLPTSNPLGLRSARGLLVLLASVSLPIALVLSIACAGSLVLRYRRTRGEERIQIKWFVYGAAFLVVCFAVGGVLSGLGHPGASGTVSTVGFFGPPVGAAVALLRHRLYDIDRVINRTLVYGAVTILLGAIYAGLAVGLGSLAGSNTNSLVIAGSTLVVAALFSPARRRVQAFIDRRFYRKKYDAVRTLESFTARLRDEVDLGELQDHLLTVVDETMQPAHASLWLRAAEASR